MSNNPEHRDRSSFVPGFVSCRLRVSFDCRTSTLGSWKLMCVSQITMERHIKLTTAMSVCVDESVFTLPRLSGSVGMVADVRQWIVVVSVLLSV